MGAIRRKLSGAQVYAHRYVDMWAFMGVHPCNLEFMQRLKMADDRQFGVNMDICGDVSERNLSTGKWEETQLVAIRTDAWNPNQDLQKQRLERLQLERQDELRRRLKSSGELSKPQLARLHQTISRDPLMKMRPDELETRRLVMKLFNSNTQRIRWAGTIEEATTRETHHSLGSRRVLLAFKSTLQGTQFVTDLHETHRTFRIPSLFTFCYLSERRNRIWYISIKRKWISVGADFVVEAEGRRIAEIDGALFGFGYNAHIYVFEQELAKDSEFVDLLTLFATTVGYQRSMRRAIRRRLAAVRRGLMGSQQFVEDEEIRLLKNPRAA